MTLTHQDISQLILHCKNGDQQAQLEVYNRYYRAMFNTAFRIVKDRFEAEDIMQDSFLSAFTKLESLKELSTFGAWLKRIVINNSIYHYKKNSKYRDVPLDEVIYKIEDDSQGFCEDHDFSNLKAQQVLATMKSLKANYQMSLSLHLIEGFDYEEICEIMDISNANCRTMISRAKEKLRQKLEEMADF
ncbi:RNA polymerase sigma factor [Subsaximicrobium wynnwilliamsii]|uniref:RNA polymerase sigma factor n=1 Tax=Subsaximicrobium wynnwilliamsii TaxID=291179 RepID=A0A5C6ZE59_9FLAO|nr:RNA polymerase sigma factor [Subsaximicrobium wynnwilliamsii]TXD83304.1 RNA polymerase sigma factor [Subsaximicrobium wynnwilliamsii]TXD87403.1 RNA polymerase sigma factor [Subsaximicrobium wynnwilliamsii]TXE03327.1 RNA polymerase sigma factor [Subsaximicrobium wynnwilliamsii]